MPTAVCAKRSVPIAMMTKRYAAGRTPKKVTIVAYDRNGKKFTVKAQDFVARAFCHEYDHLDGILYVDKATEIEDDKR